MTACVGWSRRYLGRTRDFARRGATLGVLAGLVLGISWYQAISIGFGRSPLGDLLTMGLAGWFGGLLLSARYRRIPAGDGRRLAPLAPRDPDRYRSPALTRAMASVAVLSGSLGLGALLPGDSTERWAIATLGLSTVVITGWAARTQTRIARRPQPFVTADLLAADEAMRLTSASVIGLAAIGVGLVVVGWQASYVARGLAGGSDWTWTGLLTIPPLVAGLIVAIRARRTIRPRVGLRPALTGG